MQNANDEKEAQTIIESFCPNPAVRDVALSIFGEAICEANIYRQATWAVRVEETARLTVAHYYVCTIWHNGVWLALDNQFDNAVCNSYYPTMQTLNAGGWTPDQVGQPGAYPTYKDASLRTDFSINGLYVIGVNHQNVWPHLRRLFFNFIYKANYHGQPMDPRSPGHHSAGALKYLRHCLGMNLPDPLY
jgi:hypothetical protein